MVLVTPISFNVTIVFFYEDKTVVFIEIYTFLNNPLNTLNFSNLTERVIGWMIPARNNSWCDLKIFVLRLVSIECENLLFLIIKGD